MERPEGGAHLTRIISLSVFVNGVGSPPEVWPEKNVMAAGMQGGTPVARVVNDEGQEVDYYLLPMKVVKAAPSGLVAPSRGAIVPPT